MAVFVMVKTWALSIMLGLPITSMYVFSCLETLPKTPITNGITFVLTLSSVLITLAKSVYLLTFSFNLLTIL